MGTIIEYLSNNFASYIHNTGDLIFLYAFILIALFRTNIVKIFSILLPTFVLLIDFYYNRFSISDIKTTLMITLFFSNLIAVMYNYENNLFYGLNTLIYSSFLYLYNSDKFSALYTYMAILLACNLAMIIIKPKEFNLNVASENIVIYAIAISVVSLGSSLLFKFYGTSYLVNLENFSLTFSEKNIGFLLILLGIGIFAGIWPFSYLILWQNRHLTSVASNITPIQLGVFTFILIKLFSSNIILSYLSIIVILYSLIYSLLLLGIRDILIYIVLIQYSSILASSSMNDYSHIIQSFILIHFPIFSFVSYLKRKYAIVYFYSFNEFKTINILDYILLILSILMLLIIPFFYISSFLKETIFYEYYDGFKKVILLTSFPLSFAAVPWNRIFSVRIEKLPKINMMNIIEFLIITTCLSISLYLSKDFITLESLKYLISFMIVGYLASGIFENFRDKGIILDVNWIYRNISVYKLSESIKSVNFYDEIPRISFEKIFCAIKIRKYNLSIFVSSLLILLTIMLVI